MPRLLFRRGVRVARERRSLALLLDEWLWVRFRALCRRGPSEIKTASARNLEDDGDMVFATSFF